MVSHRVAHVWETLSDTPLVVQLPALSPNLLREPIRLRSHPDFDPLFLLNLPMPLRATTLQPPMYPLRITLVHHTT
jgi:hypothetical protein